MTTFEAQLAELDALGHLEAYDKAREVFAILEPATDAERWRRDIRNIFLSDPGNPESEWYLPFDEATVALERMCDDPQAHRVDTERALLSVLRRYTYRRLLPEALEYLTRIENRLGPSPRITAQRARVYLQFDDRITARDVIEAGLAEGSDPHLHMAYAELLYVVADFEGARHHAETLAESNYALSAADLLVAVAASQGDLGAEFENVSRALELSPLAEDAPARLLHRAMVGASLDRIDTARADLERVIELAKPTRHDSLADYARRRLDALDAAGSHTVARRLEAFPSVVQKWNYCGPAVIELCLRYLGIEMTQDFIAEAVKREEGTPMRSIVAFLREQGIEARRVEATPDRVRAAIDLGIPLILEDDYSNTHHVSVAIGYDDRLGILLVADPQTHAPKRQGLESREQLASQHRYGAVAVLGRSNDVTPELRTALDHEGLAECEHMHVLDELASVRDDFSPAFAEVTALEAVGIARAALAIEPDFPMAAVIEVGSMLNAGPNLHPAFPEFLGAARDRFPDVAEFASIAATWDRRRGARACGTAESVVARVLDPKDARPYADMAYDMIDGQDRQGAYLLANQALLRAPQQPAPTLALARVLVDESIQRARTSGPLGGLQFAFLSAVAHTTEHVLQMDDAQLGLLASAVVQAAERMAPMDPNAALYGGDLALLEQDLDRGVARYEEAAKRAPEWFLPKVRMMCVLESTASARALEIAQRLIASAAMSPEGWTAVLGVMSRLGAFADTYEAAARAVDADTPPAIPVKAVFEAAERATKSPSAAAQHVVDLARSRVHRGELLDAVVDHLAHVGLRGHSVKLLRERIGEVPDDARAHFELARILSANPEFRDEAIALTERALALAPWATVVREHLAWLVIEPDPARALALAEAIPEPSFGSFELRRRALEKLDRNMEAREFESGLVAYAGTLSRARTIAAIQHLRAGRTYLAARAQLSGDPRWSDPDEVADWIHAMMIAGEHQAVRESLASHIDILDHPRVAAVGSRAGKGIGVDAFVSACRRAADLESDPARAIELEVRALLALDEIEAASELARGNVGALVACSEAAQPSSERLRLALVAAELAPHDRAVLAALHSASLETGDIATARTSAKTLYEEYPFEHQGAERMAETESLCGDIAEGTRFAAIAVNEGAQSERAYNAAAMAYAIAHDWPKATAAARRAQGRDIDPESPAAWAPCGVVLAASQRDREAYERAVQRIVNYAPHAPLKRLLEACEVLLRNSGT